MTSQACVHTSTNATDIALIDRCLNGDQSAWETLIAAKTRLIWSTCACYRGHDCETRDLVQDVLVHLLQKLSSFRNGASFNTWIIRVTKNLVTDHYRKYRSSSRHDALEPHLDRLTAPRNYSTAPDLAAEYNETGKFLNEALCKLPPDWQLILFMSAIEGLHYREIARILALPEGTVKSRLSRGRTELRRRLRRGRVRLGAK
jgi:RNA polymerase sigma-70 factor (ECF subfamily)